MNGIRGGQGDGSQTSTAAHPTLTESDYVARFTELLPTQGVDFHGAFHSARFAMAVVGRSGRITAANRALAKLFDSAAHQLTNLPVTELAGLGQTPRVRGACQAVLRGESEQMRCKRQLKQAGGQLFWAEITLVPLRRDGSALLTITDISEKRDLQERLRHLQMHDPVTQLPNRALFFERLATALTDSPTGRIGLCYLDIDGFKAINDTFGHRVGDQLLDAVGRRLARCATTGPAGGGHLVARLGGDEFAVLVEGSTGPTQLTEFAGAIQTSLARSFELAGQRLDISASIGVVERSAVGSTATELMQAADTTLYWAKADGRARWTLFDAERNAHRMTRQALSSTLRPAVQRGEFTLEFQPIVGLADDTLHGVEALVRWRHPRLGTLGPGQFIGLAEENGSIVELGRWVLAESCRQARRWQLEHEGPALFVSVNIAVRQVWDSDLVADVAMTLRETGLPAALLQLELTESAVMGGGGRPLQALHALSAMGVRIAIDDFGTGYSNLAYLSRLPVRALKLDGTFVRGFRTSARHNQADETIVTSLVDLAHKLGLTVTAECVEGQAQADRLRRIGCDTGQGWLYSRPVPADRISQLLRA